MLKNVKAIFGVLPHSRDVNVFARAILQQVWALAAVGGHEMPVCGAFVQSVVNNKVAVGHG